MSSENNVSISASAPVVGYDEIAAKPISYAFRMSIGQAVHLFPEIGGALATLEALCESDNVNTDICSFTMPGRFFLAKVPPLLAPVLSQLVTAQPSIMVRASLDLAFDYPMATWSARLACGQLYHISVHLEALREALHEWRLTVSKGELHSARLIFVAGEEVAISTVFFDDNDMFEAQACTICAQSKDHYSADELARASDEVATHGSALPWLNKLWINDEEDCEMELQPYLFAD